MFLVAVPSVEFAYYVFLREDPRPACEPFVTVDSVYYDPGSPEDFCWWSTDAPSELAFGRSIRNPSRYRLFPNTAVMYSEGYELVYGVPWIHQTWSGFLDSAHGRRLARRYGLRCSLAPARNREI